MCVFACLLCVLAHVKGLVASVPLLWSVFFEVVVRAETLFCILPQLENFTSRPVLLTSDVIVFLTDRSVIARISQPIDVTVMEITGVIENVVIFWCRNNFKTYQAVKVTSVPFPAGRCGGLLCWQCCLEHSRCSTTAFYHRTGITTHFCFLWWCDDSWDFHGSKGTKMCLSDKMRDLTRMLTLQDQCNGSE